MCVRSQPTPTPHLEYKGFNNPVADKILMFGQFFDIYGADTRIPRELGLHSMLIYELLALGTRAYLERCRWMRGSFFQSNTLLVLRFQGVGDGIHHCQARVLVVRLSISISVIVFVK